MGTGAAFRHGDLMDTVTSPPTSPDTAQQQSPPNPTTLVLVAVAVVAVILLVVTGVISWPVLAALALFGALAASDPAIAP